jgi:hypothetical protein
MGFLSRIMGGLDKVDDAKTDLELAVFRDRRFARADALAASGDPNEAVVTGIHRRFQGESGTVTKVRLEWYDPQPRVGGIMFGDELPLTVRLGSTVAIRSDGDGVALDYAAMRSTAAAREAAQRTIGSAPDQGIDDTALDARVLKALKTWLPEDATVESWERVTVMGMLSLNWNLRVRRADGTTATVPKDNVPPYARWFVARGASLPIRVDPKDATRAKVDWPELAERMAVDGGRWQDQPVPGSIAEQLLLTAGTPSESMTVGAPAELDLTPDAGSSDAIEGVTLEKWAHVEAGLTQARVNPAEHDAYATQHHGIPTGRWTSIKRQWEARQLSDWKVGAAFGEAYSAAQKELKKRPR